MFVNDLFKKNKMNEGFDELEAYMKAKLAPKPRGGAGVKQGTYGQPDRRRGRPAVATGGQGSSVPQSVDFDRPHSERSAGRRLPRYSDDHDANFRREVDEGSAQDKLHARHQELRKKSGLPDPDYYKELKASYDIEDDAKRIAAQAEIKKKYRVAETVLNPKDSQGDYDAKRKVIHDLSLDPNVDQQAVQQRRLDLDREAKSKGLKEQGVAEELSRRDFLKGMGAAALAGAAGGAKSTDYTALDKKNPYHPTLDPNYNTRIVVAQAVNQYYLQKTLAPSDPRTNLLLNSIKQFLKLHPENKDFVNKTFGEAGPRYEEFAKKDPDFYKKVLNELFDNFNQIKSKLDSLSEFNESSFEQGVAEGVEQYLEEMRRAGYDIVTEAATLCPECGGTAYADQMLAEKQDACYHKVKSRYKVWPSAYASGALVRCRKVGAKNWGNKSKK
jgi:hypothetical protein